MFEYQQIDMLINLQNIQMYRLIKAAAFGITKESQIFAENQIIQLRLEKTEEFFLEACNVLKNQKLQSHVRQAAVSVIKLSIALEIKPKLCLWDNLQPHAKKSVKDAMLSVMIDHDPNIRREATNVMAAICCIQILKNKGGKAVDMMWKEVGEKISLMQASQDLLIKETSILTLGFICERLREKEQFVSSKTVQSYILSGIKMGLSQSSDQIVETSLKVLCDSLGSIPYIINQVEQQKHLIKRTSYFISQSKHRNSGLQVLNQFTRIFYQHLNDHMKGFIILLEPIIKNYKDKENCILAIEFWKELAEEYKFRSKNDMSVRNYVTGEVGIKVVTCLLEALCVDKNQDDEEENGVDAAAAKCLETIFEEDSQEFEKLVLEFTNTNIKNSNPNYHKASIRALALLSIGADQSHSQKYIKSFQLSKDQFFKLESDQSYIGTNLSRFLNTIQTDLLKRMQLYLKENQFRNSLYQKKTKILLQDDIYGILCLKINQKQIFTEKGTVKEKLKETIKQISKFTKWSEKTIQHRMVKKLYQLKPQELTWYIQNDKNIKFIGNTHIIDKKQWPEYLKIQAQLNFEIKNPKEIKKEAWLKFERTSQKELSRDDKQKRLQLLQFLFNDIGPVFSLMSRTLEHSIKILDIYYAKCAASKSNFNEQIYPGTEELLTDFVTAIFLSSKYNEAYGPLLQDFVNFFKSKDFKVDPKTILDKQKAIFAALDHNMNIALVSDWWKIQYQQLMPVWAYWCYLDFDLKDTSKDIFEEIRRYIDAVMESPFKDVYEEFIKDSEAAWNVKKGDKNQRKVLHKECKHIFNLFVEFREENKLSLYFWPKTRNNLTQNQRKERQN